MNVDKPLLDKALSLCQYTNKGYVISIVKKSYLENVCQGDASKAVAGGVLKYLGELGDKQWFVGKRPEDALVLSSALSDLADTYQNKS